MLEKTVKTFKYGQHNVTLETGGMARQASAAVLVNMDDTVVLATVVASKNAPSDQNFFPLTVDYIEKTYAAGRIPGGFFKREGRASEKEILTSRLIDRPIRPLFPKSFYHEVQVVVTVLSLNPEVDPDIPAMIAASAALSISGVPFDGPVGACRVGYVDGEYVLNPSNELLKSSKLDLVVAGTSSAVLMVESEAQELSEEVMLGAVVYGHEQMQEVIHNINALVEIAGKPAWEWTAPEANQALIAKVKELALDDMQQAFLLTSKQERSERISATCARVSQQVLEQFPEANQNNLLSDIFHDLEASIVRSRILNGEPRIDGRDTRTVRPINIQVGVLPRTHGSALFTRGETQALAVATLGTGRDEQLIDALGGEYRENFLLHYNFPPYSTGETGRIGATKRREVGHGRLAKRALAAVLPPADTFPYTIRVVSEIMESNGSSSMASVCGGCLSLMDAGVPLKAHVAGIAMGLIKEDNRFAVLTDILGDEDHLGDMDFKVAGTEFGVTALQMDIKIQGITKEIMSIALSQAKEGRQHILGLMKQSLLSARDQISDFAPKMETIQINPEKIRDVIGKGGAVIRALQEETGTVIEISDEGLVTISSASSQGADLAKKRIEEITAEIEVDQVYEGTVIKLLDFGAIVNVLPGRDGLLHISQISHERISNVADVLKEGQKVRVKVLDTDDRGKFRLSMKAFEEQPKAES